MQGTISPTGFVAFFSVAYAVLTFLFAGVLSVSIPSIERRFHLSSQESGIIVTFYDVGACTICVILPHLLRNAHIPRTMAFSTIGVAIGCLLFALPHYINQPYIYTNRTINENLCQLHTLDNITKSNLPQTVPSKSNMVLMMFSVFTVGAFSVPLTTISYTFIEDNFDKHTASLCNGIVNAMYVFGAMAGYIIGGQFTSVYVDFDIVDNVELTERDSRWVGAWWVLFLATPIILILFSGLPLALFPRSFRKNDPEEYKSTESSVDPSPSFLCETMNVLHNKVVAFITISATLDMLYIFVISIFLPKLIKTQFNVKGQTAAMFTGLLCSPTAIFGNLVSGVLIKKYNMSVKQMLKFSLFLHIPSVLIHGPLYILKCTDDVVNSNFGNTTSPFLNGSFSGECLTACNCHNEYAPVCGDDHVTYLSPCAAGCRQYDVQDMTYTDCSCIPTKTQTAVENSCSSSLCKQLYIFTALLFIVMFIDSMTFSPMLICSMRVVKTRQRPLTLGLQSFVVRVFGTIPGQIMFGLLFDDACLMWQRDGDEEGSCWFYDKSRLSRNVVLFVLPLKLVSMLFSYLAFHFQKPAKPITEEKELVEVLMKNEKL